MDEKSFQNWKIENFSCWNENVHAKCIKSPLMFSSSCNYMELYPKGMSGLDKHLVVRFCVIQDGFSGELSFIGSDGYIMCTLQVNAAVNVLALGLKYEDVIAQIRKKDEYEDQLTLLFIPSSGKLWEQRMCTNINMQKISFEVDKNIIESAKPETKVSVCFISYCNAKGREGIFLKVAHKNERIQLTLDPHSENEKAVWIESCIRIRNNNDVLIRYEENKDVVQRKKPWTFSDSLTFKEFVDEGNSLNLCFKIVKGDLKERYNHVLFSSTGVTHVQNTNGWYPEEKSPKGLKHFASKSTKDNANPNENSVSALSKELMCLYQDQDFSDLQLKCGSVTFQVHKNILSTRSPVFKSMLSNDMREAASGTVDIEDLDVSTLARFLTFLYSGSVDDLDGKSALKLYYAADKYQVPTLKKECVDFLLGNVSVSNVCDVLSLADQHRDDVLLSAARDFILNNLNEVSRSNEWKGFMKREPLLVAETMTHFTAQDLVTKKR